MKHYLELTDVNDRPWLVAGEDISALYANNNMCTIILTGAPNVITVRKSYQEVVKVMTEAGLLKLLKFN